MKQLLTRLCNQCAFLTFAKYNTTIMLLKIDDIKTELGCSRKTVYNLISTGGLDRYVSRIGKQYFITPEKLRQYVEDKILTKD